MRELYKHSRPLATMALLVINYNRPPPPLQWRPMGDFLDSTRPTKKVLFSTNPIGYRLVVVTLPQHLAFSELAGPRIVCNRPN